MTVTIRHPHATLLADAAIAYNETLSGHWGIAAHLCAARLTDPEATARVLEDIGSTFAVTDHDHEPLDFHATPGAIVVNADVARTGAALDLFMRILCGQWNEMRYHCAMRLDQYTPNVDLTVIRAEASRAYDDTVAWDERAFPPHPNASISIAQATLPARVAYHAYKTLGLGAPGTPTFSLPEGPLRVEVAP